MCDAVQDHHRGGAAGAALRTGANWLGARPRAAARDGGGAGFRAAPLRHLCRQRQRPRERPSLLFQPRTGAGLPPVVVESCVGLATFGFATSYLVVMADNVAIASSALVRAQYPPGYAGTDTDRAVLWISLLGGAVGLPLMMLPQLDMLKFSSVIGNIGILYVVVVTALVAVGVLPGGDGQGGGSTSGSALDLWALTTGGEAPAATAAACRSWGNGCAVFGFPGNIPDALSVLSIYVFAFACTQSIPAIMAEMQNATLGRVNGVILVSISCCTAVFAICGMAGYYTYGAAVNADLLKCFAKNTISTVARAGILLSVTGSYPIFMYIVRKSVCKMLYNVEPNSLSCHKFVAITLCIFAPSYIIAMSVQSLGTNTWVRRVHRWDARWLHIASTDLRAA